MSSYDFSQYVDEHQSRSIEFINEMDTYFVRICGLKHSKACKYFEENPLPLKITFPFNQVVSNEGVKVLCRIVHGKGEARWFGDVVQGGVDVKQPHFQALNSKNITIVEDSQENTGALFDPAFALLGMDKMFRGILDEQWKKQKSKNKKKTQKIFKPHGETVWMCQYAQELIDHLKALTPHLKNEQGTPHLPLSHLVGPKVEFYLSTEPCSGCQRYFRALRQLFVQHGIDLPIVLYVNRPYDERGDFCKIYHVNDKFCYDLLPVRWDGEKYKSETFTEVDVCDPFSPSNYAALVLTIFSDAILPMLLAGGGSNTFSFFKRVADCIHNANYFVTDWLRFFQLKSLAISEFNFNSTSIDKFLTHADSYRMHSFHYLKRCIQFASEKNQKFVKALVSLAAKRRHNAIGFFIELCGGHPGSIVLPAWSRNLVGNERGIAVDANVLRLARYVKKIITWNELTVPKEAVSNTPIPEDLVGRMPVYYENKSLRLLSYEVSLLTEYVHFADMKKFDRKYQRNLLNAMLTHPATSPLGIGNVLYDDAAMTQLIESTIDAIHKLAYVDGHWNMQKLHEIYGLFRESKFDPNLKSELDRLQLQRKKKPKTLAIQVRQFSQENNLFSTGWNEFIEADEQSRRDFLNALLTHPKLSPLGLHNNCLCNDLMITKLIEGILKSISKEGIRYATSSLKDGVVIREGCIYMAFRAGRYNDVINAILQGEKESVALSVRVQKRVFSQEDCRIFERDKSAKARVFDLALNRDEGLQRISENLDSFSIGGDGADSSGKNSLEAGAPETEVACLNIEGGGAKSP